MMKLKALVLAGLAVAAFAAPAFGDSSYVTDPAGDGMPDIRRLALENNQNTVVLRQRYVEIQPGQVDTIYIKWGEPENYSVQLGNFDGDPANEKRLNYNTANYGGGKSCPDLEARRNLDTNVVVFRVPRSCLNKAPNGIFAKGIATYGQFSSDETGRTPRTPRG